MRYSNEAATPSTSGQGSKVEREEKVKTIKNKETITVHPSVNGKAKKEILLDEKVD